MPVHDPWAAVPVSPLVEVGARIRRARLRHRPPLTLAALAGEALSVGLVSKIERGLVNPSLQTLLYLAGRLGVSPAALVSDPTPEYDRSAAALAAARALLLLGDPAGAAALAAAAAGGVSSGGPPSPPVAGEAAVLTGIEVVDKAAADAPAGVPVAWRARLLGLAAEALLATGDAAGATARLVQASELVAMGNGSPVPPALAPGSDEPAELLLARAELAWVLGLIERRRGHRAAAEHSWARSLELFERLPPPAAASLEVQLACGRTLAELGALHEASGALETARHFYTRALTAAVALADPAVVARRLLARVPRLDHLEAPAGPQESDPAGEGVLPVPIAAASVLALVSAAATLVERMRHDLDRLERREARHHLQAPPLDVSHSRYLR